MSSAYGVTSAQYTISSVTIPPIQRQKWQRHIYILVPAVTVAGGLVALAVLGIIPILISTLVWTTIALGSGGVLVVGGIGYWLARCVSIKQDKDAIEKSSTIVYPILTPNNAIQAPPKSDNFLEKIYTEVENLPEIASDGFNTELTHDEINQIDAYIAENLENWRRQLEKLEEEASFAEELCEIPVIHIRYRETEGALPRSLHVVKIGEQIVIFILLKKKKLSAIGKGSVKSVKFAVKHIPHRHKIYPLDHVFANFSFIEEIISEEYKFMQKLQGKEHFAEPPVYIRKGPAYRKGNLKYIAYSGLQRYYNGGDLFSVIDPTRERIPNNYKTSAQRKEEYVKEITVLLESLPALAKNKILDLVRFLQENPEQSLKKKMITQYIQNQVQRAANSERIMVLFHNYLNEFISRKEKRLIFSNVLQAMLDLKKRGILHRDVKPLNIFLERNSDRQVERARLGDFGNACDHSTPRKITSCMPYNSPEFMRLMQADNKAKGKNTKLWKEFQAISYADEAYQFAVTMEELFNQQLLKNTDQLRSEPPEHTMEHLIWELLERDPKKRPSLEKVQQLLPSVV